MLSTSTKSQSVPSNKQQGSIAMSSTPTATIKKPSRKSFLVNFVAGGVAGTTGVILTSPLDVVQTRLQSSLLKLSSTNVSAPSVATAAGGAGVVSNGSVGSTRFGLLVFSYMRHVVKTEGFFGLYKGLVPNLMGIAPSRAIYFAVYSKSKSFLTTTHLSNSSWTHMLSALSASWSVSTLTNPIWFIKTRMQLDTSTTGQQRKIVDVVKEVFRNEGARGFYRGLCASYVGASETMIYFVLYEKMKQTMGATHENEKLSPLGYITSAFFSKCTATISVYPHEVARTRLRQESVKEAKDKLYKGFMQTIQKVYKDEGWSGLYGGMGAHLMRQVPNTVIMFFTYESIVNFLSQE